MDHKKVKKLKYFSWSLISCAALLLTACGPDQMSATDQTHNNSNTPANAPNPNAPLLNQHNEEQPTNQATEFADLQQLNTTVTTTNPYFTQRDAVTIFDQFSKNWSSLKSELRIPENLEKKYQIVIRSDQQTFADQLHGKITNILVQFQLGHLYQNVYFTLQGLKPHLYQGHAFSDKESYLRPIGELEAPITHLYPSFVAQLLYFYSNVSAANSRNLAADKLNYEAFLNHDATYFNPNSKLQLGVGFLNNFFTTEETPHYQYRVVGIKFDDLQGTLSLNMRVENEAGYHQGEPDYQQAYEFSGLRKLDPNGSTNNKNVLLFSWDQLGLKTTLSRNSALMKVIKAHENDVSDFDVSKNLTAAVMQHLQQSLYSNVRVGINDNLKVYQYAHGLLTLNQLAGLNGNFGFYPFYSHYDRAHLFDQLSLVLKHPTSNKPAELVVSGVVALPIYTVSSFQTLSDLYANQAGTFKLAFSTPVVLSELLKNN